MKKILPSLLLFIIAVPSFGQLPKSTATIKVNGIDLYYEVYGEGEPLLLLHGWLQSSKFWADYIPTYAQNFEVYVIDLRGHGKSSHITSDFRIKEAAKDVSEFLDQLKINKIKAIGLSYGGLTLLELGILSPEKLESIILIGTSHNYNGGKIFENDKAFSYENLPLIIC